MPLMPADWVYDRKKGISTDPCGREYISVTTALKEIGLSPQYPDRAFFNAWRGTKTHKAIEKLLTTHDDEEIKKIFASLDDVNGRGFLAAFMKFLRESKAEPIVDSQGVLSERKIWHPHGFAGTFDLAVKLNGHVAMIDVKTGVPMAFHGPQLFGYLLGLWSETQGIRRYGLYLKQDGTYKLKPYEDEADGAVFLSAVVVAQWKRKHGILSA